MPRMPSYVEGLSSGGGTLERMLAKRAGSSLFGGGSAERQSDYEKEQERIAKLRELMAKRYQEIQQATQLAVLQDELHRGRMDVGQQYDLEKMQAQSGIRGQEQEREFQYRERDAALQRQQQEEMLKLGFQYKTKEQEVGHGFDMEKMRAQFGQQKEMETLQDQLARGRMGLSSDLSMEREQFGSELQTGQYRQQQEVQWYMQQAAIGQQNLQKISGIKDQLDDEAKKQLAQYNTEIAGLSSFVESGQGDKLDQIIGQAKAAQKFLNGYDWQSHMTPWHKGAFVDNGPWRYAKNKDGTLDLSGVNPEAWGKLTPEQQQKEIDNLLPPLPGGGRVEIFRGAARAAFPTGGSAAAGEKALNPTQELKWQEDFLNLYGRNPEPAEKAIGLRNINGLTKESIDEAVLNFGRYAKGAMAGKFAELQDLSKSDPEVADMLQRVGTGQPVADQGWAFLAAKYPNLVQTQMRDKTGETTAVVSGLSGEMRTILGLYAKMRQQPPAPPQVPPQMQPGQMPQQQPQLQPGTAPGSGPGAVRSPFPAPRPGPSLPPQMQQQMPPGAMLNQPMVRPDALPGMQTQGRGAEPNTMMRPGFYPPPGAQPPQMQGPQMQPRVPDPVRSEDVGPPAPQAGVPQPVRSGNFGPAQQAEWLQARKAAAAAQTAQQNPPPQKAIATETATKMLPHPKSKEEYDALTPGQVFVAPDGSIRRKPPK